MIAGMNALAATVLALMATLAIGCTSNKVGDVNFACTNGHTRVLNGKTGCSAMSYASHVHWAGGGRNCTGILIEYDIVATVATCVPHKNKGEVHHVAGDSISVEIGKVFGDLPATATQKVIALFVHGHFDKTTKRHNLALLKLEHPVTVTPAKRATDHFPAGHECRAAGFGYSANRGSVLADKFETSNDLGQLDVKIKKKEDCGKQWKNNMWNWTDVVCAGTDEPKSLFGSVTKGVCRGDEGAPLECGVPGGWHLYAMLTESDADCTDPSLYTILDEYDEWLKRSIDLLRKKTSKADPAEADDQIDTMDREPGQQGSKNWVQKLTGN